MGCSQTKQERGLPPTPQQQATASDPDPALKTAAVCPTASVSAPMDVDAKTAIILGPFDDNHVAVAATTASDPDPALTIAAASPTASVSASMDVDAKTAAILGPLDDNLAAVAATPATDPKSPTG